jgi:hypothetical protein
MRELNVITAAMNHSRAGKIINSGFAVYSLVLMSSCLWMLRPSVANCAPESRSRFGGSVTQKAEGDQFDQQFMTAVFVALAYQVRTGIRTVSDLIERRFAEFAGVPYQTSLYRQQWEELWQTQAEP